MSVIRSEKLGNLCKFLNGGTPSTQVPGYFDGDIPWITGTDISEPLVHSARSYITEQAIDNSATSFVPKGTLLLVTRTSVGKVAFAGMNLCFSQDITAIVPDENHLDKSYLFHFLAGKQDYFTYRQRGATIKGITREVLVEMRIPLPPLAEQKRTAALLDEADTLCRKRREAINKLDGLSRSVFLETFGDPITNLNHWPVYDFQEVAYFQEGPGVRNWQFRESGIKLVNVKNIVEGVLNVDNTYRFLDPVEVV